MNLNSDIMVKINSEIEDIVDSYQDYSASELIRQFQINELAKNRLNVLIKRMINYSDSFYLSKIDDDNISLKTIKLDKYGRLKEAMSFPAFRYCDIVKETWKISSLRNIFANQFFIFAIFKNEGKELYLNRILIWKMPEKVLEEGVRPVWEQMKYCLSNGEIVKYIDNYGRYFTYFPASTENPYVHVRPHAQNRQDTDPLPVPDKLTGLIEYPKHSYWLNRSYVSKIIARND